ncbi:MAG: hypothetical protein JWR80_2042 [Bradyrhizobium sp.]|nr:hypothetical protein [Bradyrhizobium sp.]
MRYPSGRRSAAEVRREAAAWIARMRGPEAERSRLDFERWRAASPMNRTAYAEMQQISVQAGQLGATSVAREHLGRRRAPWYAARPSLGLAIAGIAATLVAGTAAIILLHADRVGPAATSAGPIATAVGRIDRVRLADGTLVTLDTDSEIRPAFGDTSRLVRLVRGRARFEVAQDARRPFMVEAGGRVILDRGTVFDVTLGGDGVRVALLRGAVEVRERGDTGKPGRAIARLAAGQLFVDHAEPGTPSVLAATDGVDRWVGGMLTYDAAPLSDVVAETNRYSAHKLRLGDPALASLRVTGVFRATPIETSAAALAAALHLQVVSAPNGDLILQR